MTKYASELTDFSDLLRATAQWKNTAAAIVEKDYYLTRALRALADHQGGQFVLKGGTSLSKGWNLLQRFSEDIDLLVRAKPGETPGARHTRLRALAETVKCAEGFTSAEVIKSESETGKKRPVRFAYQSVTSDDPPTLSKTVLLEAGYRGNAGAAISRPVKSMVTEFAEANGHAGLAQDLAPFEIEMQSVTRTFVEKLFAAHAAYQADKAKRKARHYYDLFEMSSLPEVREFVGTGAYRQCFIEVREISKEEFPNQAVPTEDSFQASPALKPDATGLNELENNWREEQDLYFGQQPRLADVLQALGKLLPKL